MRFGLVALVSFLCPILATAQTGNLRNAGESSPEIELKLIPEKTVIRPGETLRIKVELWNVGADDIIIAQHIDATFGNSDLELFLEVGSTLQGATTHLIADSIPDPHSPDLAKTFVKNWLTLNKAHCYGTYVYMDPMNYPQLRKPGHYRIRAEYSSRGISSVPGWNGGWLKQEDIDKLPFKAWKGTVNSNFVSIQVRTPTKKSIEK
ncbi:MAG: hypothetical protein ACYDCM_04040 [Candidatus Acidiferrales bacterium]